MQKGKTVLVTGGAGYVGGVLVPELLDRGYGVKVLDSCVFGTEGLDAVMSRIELVRGDIRRPPAGIMDGIHAVIHLGGVSSQARSSNRSPRYTDLVNHIATETIAKEAKNAGVARFVLASSCSIYCTYKHNPDMAAPLYTENDSVIMCNAYALSKRASEEALLELADGSFHPVFLRKGTLYGYSPKMRYDLIVNSFTKDAFSKKKITVSAMGELYRPMVDIRDAVNAYIAAFELPAETVSGKAFNVVRENWKIGDLAREFVKAVKQEKGLDIDIEFKPFEVAYSYQADHAAFDKTFKLAPTRSLAQAVTETWNALENGSDYTNPRYFNDAWYDEAFKNNIL